MNKYINLDTLTKKVNEIFNTYANFPYSLDVIEHVQDNKDFVCITGTIKDQEEQALL